MNLQALLPDVKSVFWFSRQVSQASLDPGGLRGHQAQKGHEDLRVNSAQCSDLLHVLFFHLCCDTRLSHQGMVKHKHLLSVWYFPLTRSQRTNVLSRFAASRSESGCR